VLIVFGVTRLPEIGVTLDRVVDVTRSAAQFVEAETRGTPELPAPRESSNSGMSDDGV
jgi:Sec-independent protein translocase protein TatA